MHILRFTRLILLNALSLAVLLTVAPSVEAYSLTHALPLTCPRISSFTPSSGPSGTSVTIIGCGFTGSTTVAFHGISASFSVNSDTQITATVPNGATSGLITVTTPTRTVKSPSKFIVPPPTPAETLSPTVGPPTSSLRVSGSNFGSYEAVDVYFDTTDEALASTNALGQFSSSISIPSGAVPGTHWVTAVGRHSGRSAQASFLVQTDWVAFHNLPTHTGTNPYENVLSPTNVGKLDTSWSATTGSYVSSPAVANGVVYADSGDNHLYAFNAQTGTQLWSVPTSTYVYSSPAVANGVVYVGSGYGLAAYNAQTGAQLWFALTGYYVTSSPAVVNGVVYVGSDDHSLYAFNAQTGAQLWSAATDSGITSSPAVVNGVVYVGSGYYLYAYNAQTGAQLWSAATGSFIESSPAVANGAVYVGSDDYHLYAFNAQTGGQLWSVATGYNVTSSPAVANGVVYVGSFDLYLYAYNAQTGALLWSAATRNSISSSPAVANGVVYVGSADRYVYAYNAQTGAQLWSALTGGSINSSPAVANGMVYISSNDYSLYAYALPPGNQLKPPARPNPASLKPNLKLPVRP